MDGNTIVILVNRQEVYDEVAKTTDYVASKAAEADDKTRDRLLITDADLAELERLWQECATAANEELTDMLVSGSIDDSGNYVAVFEVSRAWDAGLEESVRMALRSFFITSMVGQWFKLASSELAEGYFANAGDLMLGVERLLYARKRPMVPTD